MCFLVASLDPPLPLDTFYILEMHTAHTLSSSSISLICFHVNRQLRLYIYQATKDTPVLHNNFPSVV